MKKTLSLLVALAFGATAFAQSTKYVKLKAAPETWEGTYLIVYEVEVDDDNNIANVFDGSLEDLDAKGNFITATNDYEIINGNEVRVINSSEEVEAVTFTVTKSETEGCFNIQSKSGLYIGYNSSDPDPETGEIEPDLKCSDKKKYDNTIELATNSKGKTETRVTAKNGFELRFNADEGKERFRYHASGKKKKIQFYRQEQVDEFGNIVTAIKSVESPASSASYNLSGQKVNNDFRGLLIKDGKKVIKK